MARMKLKTGAKSLEFGSRIQSSLTKGIVVVSIETTGKQILSATRLKSLFLCMRPQSIAIPTD